MKGWLVEYSHEGEHNHARVEAETLAQAIEAVKRGAPGLTDAGILSAGRAATEEAIDCICGTPIFLDDVKVAARIKARAGQVIDAVDARLAEMPQPKEPA